ncbi:MobA/MobL family protein [Sphingomicrobium astaxanthinifaciens]|uniref:MobA/MobL family protein n=1 Tax=Sphingomicrobium astaxanthinifaciens TaxID=1227949 RepID=UPI001FCA94DE|nr:MobA/MobL family protein [Sphingomicrobium astaxanthinifaciens]MCJ7420435.1 MobA/MobL family protein [Sphingomicrobium astaxanthinifaciens]
MTNRKATKSKTIALKPFWEGDADDPFSFARFNWEEGLGERESIAPMFLAKRRPGAKEGNVDTAERVELLLPADAPEIYADPDFLVSDYEKSLSAKDRLAFAQVTMRFAEAMNLHGPYEVARQWLREQYVKGRGLPLLLVLHAPFRMGSDNAPHVHAMVLPRKLTRFGWSKVDRRLGSDGDRATAREAWLATAAEQL